MAELQEPRENTLTSRGVAMQSSHSSSKNPLKQVIQHGPTCGKLVAISAGLLFLLPLTNCGRSDPDCGSSVTQDLIVQIAKDHKNNRLINYAIGNSKSLQRSKEDAPSIQPYVSRMKSIKAEMMELKAQLNETKQSLISEFKTNYGDFPWYRTSGPEYAEYYKKSNQYDSSYFQKDQALTIEANELAEKIYHEQNNIAEKAKEEAVSRIHRMTL
jgi:hypothetical protein